MTSERNLSEFHMSRRSPSTDAKDFMAAFDARYPGLFTAAERALTDATRRRQLIFWIGSAAIVAAFVLLWWSNSQGITSISPWMLIAVYAVLWGFNKWRKAVAKREFKASFDRAGVSEAEYRNLSHAVALVGYSGVMMIAFSEMGAFSPPMEGGAGDIGAADFGGGFGGGDFGGG